MGRLTALLAGWPVGLRVGVGFAAVLIVGFSVLLMTRPYSGTEVARNTEVPETGSRESVDLTTVPLSVDSTIVAAPSEADTAAGKLQEPVRIVTRPKHAETTGRKATVINRRTELASNSKQRTQTQRSLRLNNFEEDEDTTLRLADLLEEVGSL